MKCEKCGTEFIGNFCPGCGIRCSELKESSKENEQKSTQTEPVFYVPKNSENLNTNGQQMIKCYSCHLEYKKTMLNCVRMFDKQYYLCHNCFNKTFNNSYQYNDNNNAEKNNNSIALFIRILSIIILSVSVIGAIICAIQLANSMIGEDFALPVFIIVSVIGIVNFGLLFGLSEIIKQLNNIKKTNNVITTARKNPS